MIFMSPAMGIARLLPQSGLEFLFREGVRIRLEKLPIEK
jgi:hypothetical protein